MLETPRQIAGVGKVWFFYPYNGPGTAQMKPIDDSVGLSPFGIHTGDWERVTLTVDNNLVPRSMYMSQHASGARVSLDAKALSKRIEVFSSRNGHATNNDTGSNLTEHHKEKALGVTVYDVGLRNDTAGGGPTLDCAAKFQLLDVNPPAWLDYNGRWGPVVDYTAVVNKVLADIPKLVRSPFKSILNALPDEAKGYKGPDGPKMKGKWNSGD